MFMANQVILHASEDYGELDTYLRENQVKKIFLVCGRSIQSLRINGYFNNLEAGKGIQVIRFSDFRPNPIVWIR